MDVLKMTLNEDAKVIKFAQDFKVMRGSYKNILINIEVPHSLLVEVVKNDDKPVTGNNVRVGAIIRTATGMNLPTKKYELSFIKDFQRDGIDYRLYQRKCPKIFTMWETVSLVEKATSGLLEMVINVVNWSIDDKGAKIEEIHPSQIVPIEIHQSEFLDDEEEIQNPSDFDLLQSQVQDELSRQQQISSDLYGTEEDTLGTYLSERLVSGNKISIERDTSNAPNNRLKISLEPMNASEVLIQPIKDIKSSNVQGVLEELNRRTDSQSVDTIKGIEEGLIDNTDPSNPVILHDKTKADQKELEENYVKTEELDARNYATEDFVKEKGGKIDVIEVNDVPQEIKDKKVKIKVPIKYTDLTNDNNTVEDANYVHTDNNYTTEEKDKLAGLESYVGTEVKNSLATLTTKVDANLAESKKYTDDRVAGLINQAPAALDTLKEIADALNEDQTALDTLNEAIGTKVNKSTKVNGKTLEQDIALTYSDVNALPDTTTLSDFQEDSTHRFLTDEERNKLKNIEAGANKTVVIDHLSELAVNPVQSKVITAALNETNTNVSNLTNRMVEVEANKVDKTRKINNRSLESDITLTKSDIGLSNVDNTSDLKKPISTVAQAEFDKINNNVSGLDTRISNVETKNKEQDVSITNLSNDKVDKVDGKQLSTNDFTDALKIKLDGIETGAQVNKIEKVFIDGKEQTIVDEKIDLSISPFYKATNVDSQPDSYIWDITIPGFTLKVGSKIEVSFGQYQTPWPSLRVNDGEIIDIYHFTNGELQPITNYNNADESNIAHGWWEGGDTVQFIYNGTYWIEIYNVTKGQQVGDFSKDVIKQTDITREEGNTSPGDYSEVLLSAVYNNGNTTGTQTAGVVKSNNLKYYEPEQVLIVKKIASEWYGDSKEVSKIVTSDHGVFNQVDSLIQNVNALKTTTTNLQNDKADRSEIPNVDGFITNTVNNLTNYYLKTETYTQAEVNNLINSITTINIQVVSELPDTAQANLIYLKPATTTGTENTYDEFIYINNSWEKIGSTSVDITNYYNKTEVDTKLNEKLDKTGGTLTGSLTLSLGTNKGIRHSVSKNIVEVINGNYSNSTADDIKIGNTEDYLKLQGKTITVNGSQVATRQDIISSLNNSKLTIKQNGTEVGSFTANSSTDKEVDITVPTSTSQLTNDSGFISNDTETDPTVPSHVKNITSTDITNWNNKLSSVPSEYITESDLANKNYATKNEIPSAITVDTALSSTSTNPVQNKIVNSALSNKLNLTGGNVSGHIYLTGAQASSSTGNTSQLVFGTSEDNHIAITSNKNALVLNPTTSSSSNQVVFYTNTTTTSKIPSPLNIGGTTTTPTLNATSAINVSASGTINLSGTTNATGAKLKWETVNSNTPYIGYASDQTDGTFVIGSNKGTNYASGLAIGGGSGNLLWKGTKVATTADIPTNYATKQEAVYFVDGTGNTTAGTWAGTNNRITSYYDGLVVNFKVGVAGASTTTLNINGLGAKTCYLRGTSKVTTHYAVGTMVLFTYNATTDAFYSSDYDANSSVTQTLRESSSYNGNFPLLLRGTSAGTTTTTTSTSFGTKMTANPYTGELKATSFTENGTALELKYLGISDTAVAATKATQDGDGKIISATYAKKTELPTKTSQLANDSGFITGNVVTMTTDQTINSNKTFGETTTTTFKGASIFNGSAYFYGSVIVPDVEV